MRLARLAVLYLSPPQENWKGFKLAVGDCEIKSVQSDIKNTDQQRLILAAETKLKYRPKGFSPKLGRNPPSHSLDRPHPDIAIAHGELEGVGIVQHLQYGLRYVHRRV